MKKKIQKTIRTWILSDGNKGRDISSVYYELPHWLSGKEITSNAEDTRDAVVPWVENIPWSRKWQPSPILLPVIIYGHRSVATVHGVAKSLRLAHAHTHTSLYLQHLFRKLIVSFCSVHWKCVCISRIWKSPLWNVFIKENSALISFL